MINEKGSYMLKHKILFMLFAIAVVFAKVVMLHQSNTVTLRGEIDDKSISALLHDMIMIENNPSQNVILHLNSPGGNVQSGNLLINQINMLKELGINVICIANYVASMAFAILQSCTTRYAQTSSILMQHQATFNLYGNSGIVNNMLEYTKTLLYELEYIQAKRLNISLSDFKMRIMNEWWLTGSEALEHNVIDELIYVKCHEDMIKQNITIILDKSINIYSACPIIVEPLVVIY